jgi:cyclopropane fatty-acyl-phospholipid synthase-like methyltransferase
MSPNKTAINSLYDAFFLSQNFNSEPMQSLAQSEVDWLLPKLRLPKAAKFLDAACGTGRHLKALVNHGYTPYGVDLSTECIKQARINNPTLTKQLFEDDILSFSKTNEILFDAILVAGASFGYESSMEKNQAYFKQLAAMLNKSGFLILQFVNKSWAKSRYPSPQKFWNEKKDYFCLDSREIKESILHSQKTYIFKDGKDTKTYSDSVFLFSANELEQMISEHSNNLVPVDIFDCFTDKIFNDLLSSFPVMILKNKPT